MELATKVIAFIAVLYVGCQMGVAAIAAAGFALFAETAGGITSYWSYILLVIGLLIFAGTGYTCYLVVVH